MRKLATLTGLLALGLSATPASAQSWSDFISAFPVMPCQDGWVGCVVDGEVVSPDMREKSGSAPMPADLRVSWFSLEPTASFNPYPGLSRYTGELTRPEPPPQQQADETMAANDGGGGNGGGGGGDTFTPSDPPPPVNSGVSGASGGGGDTVASNDSTPDNTGKASIKDLQEQLDQGTPDGDPGEGETEGKIEVAPPPGGDDCSNRKALEPKAMLGKLSEGQISCLETTLASVPKQTEKDKISRVLMQNAWAAGDRKAWEKLVKRHLDEIDRSDPNICYRYAMHLFKTGRSSGAIRWADTALENKTLWTGTTYTNRVDNLLKLRAAAAQKIWASAEKKKESDPSDGNRAAAESARNKTKVLAREWYEFSKSAGKNADRARALCVQAAGTEDYCEGA